VFNERRWSLLIDEVQTPLLGVVASHEEELFHLHATATSQLALAFSPEQRSDVTSPVNVPLKRAWVEKRCAGFKFSKSGRNRIWPDSNPQIRPEPDLEENNCTYTITGFHTHTHTHTRLLKYGSIYAGFKTKEYKKIKIQKNNTN